MSLALAEVVGLLPSFKGGHFLIAQPSLSRSRASTTHQALVSLIVKFVPNLMWAFVLLFVVRFVSFTCQFGHLNGVRVLSTI